jgi:hypothetical protein
MSEYNGWTNWETWNVNLWMTSNDSSLYAEVQSWAWSYSEDSAKELFLKHYPSGKTPDENSDADFSKVNWVEIKDSWNQE